MKWNASLAAAVLCLGAQVEALSIGPNRDSRMIHSLGPQGMNLWKLAQLEQRSAEKSSPFVRDSQTQIRSDSEDKDNNAGGFRAQRFRQRLDHFDSTSQDVFDQRYWVHALHYKPRKGAPVIVLDCGQSYGEKTGEVCLSYLETGIVEILTKATNGIGIVLEHRYYGKSIPVANFSTDSLRFLSVEQALADSANFMKNVKLDGIQEDLTAPNTPWIYYGGAYAGARAAFMKVLYPDIVWGAIASSGITHASLHYWEYYETIREAADPKCSDNIVNSISTIDDILSNSPSFKRQLKNLFGLKDLKHDEDFVWVLSTPLSEWEYKNWDSKIDISNFDRFCETLDLPFGRVSAADMELPFGHPKRMVSVGQDFAVDMAIVNYGKYIKPQVYKHCRLANLTDEEVASTVEECFGTFNDTVYQNTDIEPSRVWNYEQCTQLGLFLTAPPDPNIPRIVSRLLTLEYESKICQQAFPPGEYSSVPALPNITAINAFGGFDIAADRLAFIDGEVDPYRPSTPHSNEAHKREDTVVRPFKLITNGVLHYDENGLKNILDEPFEIRKIHEEEIAFVNAWLNDWNVEHGIEG